VGSFRVSLRHWPHHHAQPISDTGAILETERWASRPIAVAFRGFQRWVYALSFLAARRKRALHARCTPPATAPQASKLVAL
jgi:hypothetical protein